MGLTSLARNLIVGILCVIIINVFPPPDFVVFFILSLLIIVGVFFFTPKQGGKTEGTMDKALINVDRFFKGQAPTPGQIASVLYFNVGEIPSEEAAKEAMQRLADQHLRMRQIPVKKQNMSESYWTEPPSPFDINNHVFSHDIIEGGIPELEKKANEIINQLVPLDKPWWSIDILTTRRAAEAQDALVEECDENLGGAVIIRIHHAIGDGLRLVAAFGEVMRFADGSAATLELLGKMSAKKLKIPKPSGGRILKDFVTAATLDQMDGEPTTPVHKKDSLLPNEQPRATYTAWVPFQYVKEIRAATPGATINDVILSAFIVSIRKYCEKQGQPLNSNSFMRAMCAFSMPDRTGKGGMYNDFLMPSMELPVNVEGRAERVAAVQKVMANLKTSLVGPIQEKLVALLSNLGLDALLSDTQVKVFGKHSFVYSNVPGFEKDVFLFSENALVRKIAVYYPNVLSQCIFLTFRGQLGFSLVTDKGEVPNMDQLVDFFTEEITQWKNDVSK